MSYSVYLNYKRRNYGPSSVISVVDTFKEAEAFIKKDSKFRRISKNYYLIYDSNLKTFDIDLMRKNSEIIRKNERKRIKRYKW